MTVRELQRQRAPKDDLTPFAGQWVALRDGRVIASDIDAVALRDHPDVSEDDVLMPVPPTGQSHYIL